MRNLVELMLEFINVEVGFKVFGLSVLTLIFVEGRSDLGDCLRKFIGRLGFGTIRRVFKDALVRWSVLGTSLVRIERL